MKRSAWRCKFRLLLVIPLVILLSINILFVYLIYNEDQHSATQEVNDDAQLEKTSLPLNSTTEIKCAGKHPWTSNVPPLAPPFFYPPDTHGVRLELPQCKRAEKKWENSCCRPVFLIGSGKCGSTTLAMLLKHNESDNYVHHDRSSGFADGGKEPCLGVKNRSDEAVFYQGFKGCSTCSDNSSKLVVLDACGMHQRDEHARKIACTNPDAKLLMLVKDPTIRAISDHNDMLIRGQSKKNKNQTNRSKHVLSGISLSLSDYHKILKSFLKYFPAKNILIVQSDFLKDPDNLQHVLSKIQEHFGVPKRSVKPLIANSNQNDVKYALPYKHSLRDTINQLCPKTLAFFNLVQYRFDWILTMEDERAERHFDKTTDDTNRPQIKNSLKRSLRSNSLVS